jgi:hypothetical protein
MRNVFMSSHDNGGASDLATIQRRSVAAHREAEALFARSGR